MNDMERVVDALSVVLLGDGAALWLMTPQWALGDRVPLDLIAMGHADRVVEVIELTMGKVG